MYIDVHSHQNKTNSYSIINIVAGKEPIPIWNPGQAYSIGIHPWYLDTFEKAKDTIEITVQLPVIKAIGECGLDLNSGFPIEIQKSIFEWHIHLSEKYKKPLIIHCVKAHNDLISIRKKVKPEQPWILHGFNSNETTLQQCINQDLYISIGPQIFNSKTNIYKLAQKIPLNRTFFESDESIISIEEVYAQYEYITGIPISEISQTIHNNFINCFKTI